MRVIDKVKEKNKKSTFGMAGTLRIKLKGKDGKELLETKIEGPIEKRFSKRTGKAIQIVYKENNIVHLHCKYCGNEWKINENIEWTNKFYVEGMNIKCLKCGKAYVSG